MLALILAAQVATAPMPSAPPHILVLGAMLQGCWEQSMPNGHVLEQWMPYEAGLIMGMSRTVRDDKVREYEFLLIRQTNDTRIDLVAKPSGQAEVTFSLKTFTSDEVVFENLAHDFPQRVIYRWAGNDAMTGRIEGEIGGQAKAVDFPYKRCPTGN
jgi:hypothetical protein